MSSIKAFTLRSGAGTRRRIFTSAVLPFSLRETLLNQCQVSSVTDLEQRVLLISGSSWVDLFESVLSACAALGLRRNGRDRGLRRGDMSCLLVVVQLPERELARPQE